MTETPSPAPRAGVLQFFHEASCLSPRLVTRQDFLGRHHLVGDAARAEFRETQNWLGGVLNALDGLSMETEIGLCTACLPGGPVARDAFEHLLSELLESLQSILANGPLVHLFLLLHGALLVDQCEDPEGRIVRAVRALIGDQTTLAISLDFHANISAALVETADIVIGGKLYPHTDTAERGARLVHLATSGEVLKTHRFPMGLAVPMPRQETLSGPFGALARLSDGLETGAIRDASLLGGFPYSRAPFRGTALLVTTSDPHATEAVAKRMAKAIDAVRQDLVAPILSIEQALPQIRQALSGGRVVIGDVGDNPGGGGNGDTTDLLPVLLSLERPFAFAFLINEGLVRQAVSAGVGASFQLPTAGGDVETTILALPHIAYRNTGPMMKGERLDGGQGAVLGVGPSRILLSSNRVQAYDTNAFTAFGVDLDKMDIVAVKSIAHFRASYRTIATGGVVLVDSFGLSSPLKAPAFEADTI
ncbi:M81 family metallopeptidase [Cohaesibacter sp. ES.047]|uniref:M81 family metallopeptidase n=1 Tax=Cohaesibacter sp. ES.047 TaxID=1798205 RepID=UPI00156099B4|nr:M81 family metallopeptidase [Cohaesibacter sp. ES.047]